MLSVVSDAQNIQTDWQNRKKFRFTVILKYLQWTNQPSYTPYGSRDYAVLIKIKITILLIDHSGLFVNLLFKTLYYNN